MNRLRSPSPIQLHNAGWSDLDEVMEVMTAAFEPQFGEAWTRAQCAGILPMHGVKMILARDSGPSLGFSLVRQVADESELLLLAVRPEARRHGIGSCLVRRFIEDGGSANLKKLHLEVRDGNDAVHLYRRHDFTVEGRRSQYYKGLNGQHHDALTMVRLL
jgi:[ribosomal protein S18]-alanine N-acetyltransferase